MNRALAGVILRGAVLQAKRRISRAARACVAPLLVGYNKAAVNRSTDDQRLSSDDQLPNEEERTQTANHCRDPSLPGEKGRRTQHPGNGKRFGSLHRLFRSLQRTESAAGQGLCPE